MAFKLESHFEWVFLECVVIFTDMGHRCGYVGVKKDSPLYGLSYTDKINSPQLSARLKEVDIGKRGIIPVVCGRLEGDEISLNILFDVHGSLTYAAGNGKHPIEAEDTWWFGFDCGHAGDAKDWDLFKQLFPKTAKHLWEIESKFPDLLKDGEVRTKEYAEQECRNLAEQILAVETVLFKKQ